MRHHLFIVFTSLCLVLALNNAFGQCIEGNCFNGNGTFRYENSDEYAGLWRQGKLEGYGVYTFQSGDVYKGAFVAGKMQGRGTYIYSNGDRYIGMWKDGKMEGRGHFYWNLAGDLMDDAKLEGNFKAGKPDNMVVKDTGVPYEPKKMN